MFIKDCAQRSSIEIAFTLANDQRSGDGPDDGGKSRALRIRQRELLVHMVLISTALPLSKSGVKLSRKNDGKDAKKPPPAIPTCGLPSFHATLLLFCPFDLYFYYYGTLRLKTKTTILLFLVIRLTAT